MARRLAVCISHAPGLCGNAGLAAIAASAITSASLRQFLGEPDVARHLGQPGDEPRGLDPPDRFDGALGRKLRVELSMGGGVDQIRRRRGKPAYRLTAARLLDHLVVAVELLLAEAEILGRDQLADLDLHVAVAVGCGQCLTSSITSASEAASMIE